MSEPLGAGIKRIIWVATDKRYHRVISVWSKWDTKTLAEWKKYIKTGIDCYFTKHEIWV